MGKHNNTLASQGEEIIQSLVNNDTECVHELQQFLERHLATDLEDLLRASNEYQHYPLVVE
jgi:hypothetical protein